MTQLAPQEYRRRHRQSGEIVPPHEVQRLLHFGWSLVGDSAFEPSIDGALLAPPAQPQQQAE